MGASAVTFWLIGDEEPEDPRFIRAGIGACGLYFMAGAACMRTVRYRRELEMPPDWTVSDRYVKSWPNGVRLANRLVDTGLWYRVDGGYAYEWIRTENTPAAVRKKRARERDKKARQAGNKTA
jgi:hypothetical protein